MNSRLRRSAMLASLAAAVPLAALLSGCAGTANAAANPAPNQAPAPSTANPAVQPSTGATADAGAQAASVDGSGVTRVPSCRSSGLRVSVRPVDHAMSQTRSLVLFRNTSHRTCTLYGYPGVSFVRGEKGLQTGDPARRTGDPKRVVSLRPGGVAHAVLDTVSPDVSPGCRKVSVRGFRVYPPNETAAVFVPAPQQACSAHGKSVPSITPVKPGAAES